MLLCCVEESVTPHLDSVWVIGEDLQRLPVGTQQFRVVQDRMFYPNSGSLLELMHTVAIDFLCDDSVLAVNNQTLLLFRWGVLDQRLPRGAGQRRRTRIDALVCFLSCATKLGYAVAEAPSALSEISWEDWPITGLRTFLWYVRFVLTSLVRQSLRW